MGTGCGAFACVTAGAAFFAGAGLGAAFLTGAGFAAALTFDFACAGFLSGAFFAGAFFAGAFAMIRLQVERVVFNDKTAAKGTPSTA